MKRVYLIAALFSLFTFTSNAQETNISPRENLIKISASYGGDYWKGLGIGYERLLGTRHYLGINGYSDFDSEYETSLSYKIHVMRIGRLSLLGGMNLNYSAFDYISEANIKTNVVSFNPLLELRLRVTRKVDVTAGYNWKSTTLHHTNDDLKALNGGWGIGVNIKF